MKTWPEYTVACRKDVDTLLKKGGSLSAYRASSAFPDWKGPAKDSWAWRLERELEHKFKVKYAVACNSGTAALHMALHSLNLRSGSVIVPPYSFSATVSAVLMAGLTPIFADIHPYDFCLDPEAVKRVITKETKAILPVSLFGYRPDYDGQFRGLGLPVVEDGAQAVGARRNGSVLQQVVSSQVLSFNGAKNLPSGEGGALITNSGRIAERARLLMNHGCNFGGPIGYNYRINEVTACIAWHGLMELEERNRKRVELASALRSGLMNGLPLTQCLLRRYWGPEPLDGSHVFYTFPFFPEKCKNRSRFIRRMKRKGYTVQSAYTQPLHTLPAFRKYQRGPLPVVEDVHKRLCLLNNVRPPSTEKQMREMAIAMREALE